MPQKRRTPVVIEGVDHFPCSRCHAPKPAEDFYRATGKAFGIRYACKICTKKGDILRAKRAPTVRKMYDKDRLFREYLAMDDLHHNIRIMRLANEYGAQYPNPIEAIAARIRYCFHTQTGKDPISQEIEQAITNFNQQKLAA